MDGRRPQIAFLAGMVVWLAGEKMASTKEIVRKLLDNLPDDCTLDEVQYHLWVRQRIEEGRQEIRDGKYFTQEEMEKDLSEWIGE